MKNCPLKIFYINICIYVNCSYLFSHTLKTASETFIKPHLYSHLQFFSCANTIKMCTVFKRKQHITDTSLSYNFMPSLIKSTAMYVIWMLCFLPIHKNSSFELNEDEDILCMPGHWEKRLPTMIFQELCATTWERNYKRTLLSFQKPRQEYSWNVVLRKLHPQAYLKERIQWCNRQWFD